VILHGAAPAELAPHRANVRGHTPPEAYDPQAGERTADGRSVTSTRRSNVSATTGSSTPTVVDRGVSLIEVLVAVVLLGIGGAATMTALGASIRGSSTFETKIAGLAVIETVASGLSETVEPCTDAAYQAAARAAIPATGWGSSAFGSPDNITASVVCGAAFHVVTLTYMAPNDRGSSELRLTLGGPTVSSTTPGGTGDTPPTIGDTTCEVVSLTAAPPTMTWYTDRVLDEDVTVSVQLAGNCAEVRARFSPMNDGTFLYLPVSDSGVLLIPGRVDIWLEGVANARFEHELTAWTPMNGGATFQAFTVDECVLGSVSVGPSSVTLHESGRLSTSAAVSATASGVCDGLTWSAATGIGESVAGGAVTRTGALVTGSVAGDPTGELWAAGPKNLDIIDRHGKVIGTATMDVVQP
jgi:prepilin-type N-terminal cleavage/methylation domain-containing protein